MEWNHKNPLQWDWENLGFLSGKEREISNSTEQSNWRVGGGSISNGSMHSPGSGTCSGSELLNGSSKNSISTSVGSLIDIGNVISEVNLEAAEGNLMGQIKNKNKKMTPGDDNQISPVIAGCICTGEPPIGLKLGKRTYFENLRSTNFKNSSSVDITPSAVSVKRSRESHQAIQHSYCQVEGCNIDLTTAKDYHRKHRVCASHSKSPRVIVAGHERRFCQQCSRFHDLSEFDQKKRSCRRRLSDHNARRRKPQPETISFKPSRLPPEFYDDRQHMNFYLNLAPLSHVKQPSSTSSLWEHSHGFIPSMTKGSWNKQTKTGVDGQLHLPVMDFSHTVNASRDDFNRIMPFKLATTEALNQGQEASVSASNFNGAPDLHSALSLLSNDAWCPSSVVQSSMIHLASTGPISASQSPIAQAANSVPECWQDYHSLAEHALTFNLYGNENQIQELHLSKASFESPFIEANQLFSKPDGHFLESKT